MSNNDHYLSSREAQQTLGRTDRQLRRYAESGRVRTRVQGGRVQYHAGDVDRLRQELRPDDRPHVPDQQIIPAGEMLDLVRSLQQQIAESAAREGYLRAQLDTRPRLEDQQAIQAQLADERANRQLAERQLQDAQARLDRSERRGQLATIAAVVFLTLLIVAVLWYFGIR
jgi:hypothetical protein